jgi:hypothetical protein
MVPRQRVVLVQIVPATSPFYHLYPAQEQHKGAEGVLYREMVGVNAGVAVNVQVRVVHSGKKKVAKGCEVVGLSQLCEMWSVELKFR